MDNPIRNTGQVTEFSFPWKESISNFCSNYFAQVSFLFPFPWKENHEKGNSRMHQINMQSHPKEAANDS